MGLFEGGGGLGGGGGEKSDLVECDDIGSVGGSFIIPLHCNVSISPMHSRLQPRVVSWKY
jgi:hypothetical protein